MLVCPKCQSIIPMSALLKNASNVGTLDKAASAVVYILVIQSF
jgi:hypothetical protein